MFRHDFLPLGLTRTPTGPHSNGIAAYFFDLFPHMLVEMLA